MQMKDGVKRLSGTFMLLLCTCYIISTSNISIANDLSVRSWKLANYVSSMVGVRYPNYILLPAGNDTYPSFTFGFSKISDYPVGENATLDLGSEHGSFVRSTITSNNLSPRSIILRDVIYFFSYYGYNFMRLDPNAHLRRNNLHLSKSSIDIILDVFSGDLRDYFRAYNDISMNKYEPTAVECAADSSPSTIPENVKQSSCEPIFFRYYDGASPGKCTLPSELLTLKCIPGGSLGYKVMTFIQVQMMPACRSKNRSILYIFASLIGLVFVIGICLYVWMKRNPSRAKESDCQIDVFVDTVTRFSFEALKLATQDFKTRLGRGGFGSVFEGTLGDGTKIAVKQLNSFGQGNKEFTRRGDI